MGEQKQFCSSDGCRFVVREAKIGDAQRLLEGTKAVVAERLDYLITQPQEFAIGIDEEKQWIQGCIRSDNLVLLVAELGTNIIGWASLPGSTRLRKRHTALLGISVARLWRGCGVGTALIRTVLDWASESKIIEKVKLEAIATNQRVLGLYRRLGFLEIEDLLIAELEALSEEAVQQLLE